MKIIRKLDGFFINFAVLIAAWGGLTRRSFNNDTLWHMVSPHTDIGVQIQDGRYLNALIDYLLLKLDLSTTTHTGITSIAALILLAAALCVVQSCFSTWVDQEGMKVKLGFYAVTALLFVNILFAESLFFVECALAFGLAYLFASIGVLLFTRKKYVSSFLLFVLASTGYQVSVVYGGMIVSAYIFMDHGYTITKKTVKEQLIGLWATFGAGILNMFSTKILVWLGVFSAFRKESGLGELSHKISFIAQNYVSLLKDSKDVLPDLWIPGLFMAVLAVLIIVHFVRQNNKKAAVYFTLLFVALNLMIYAIPFMQKYIYLPPRIIWVIYVVQSMTALIALLCVGGKAKELVCYLCCGYLLLQILVGNYIVAERRVSNAMDEVYAGAVYEEILEYEAQTGRQVTKLAVANDLNCAQSYNEISYKVDQINERALGIVTNTLVNVVCGREFEKAEMDPNVFKQYFEGKDWDYFDASRQLVIIGDTAYWLIF